MITLYKMLNRPCANKIRDVLNKIPVSLYAVIWVFGFFGYILVQCF